MKKFIVETYYTCTFKTVHTLDNLNDHELSKIDNRNDGEVEVIDVKLNNRKTKKIGDKKQSPENKKTILEVSWKSSDSLWIPGFPGKSWISGNSEIRGVPESVQ